MNRIYDEPAKQPSSDDKFQWTPEASLVFSDAYDLKRDQENDSSADPVFYAPIDATLPATLVPLLSSASKNLITLSNIPAYLDRESILNFVTEELGGSQIVTFDLSAPNSEKNFYRLGWIQLEDAASSDALAKLEEKGSIEGAKIYFGLSSSHVHRFRVATTAEPDEDAFKAAVKLVSELEGSSHAEDGRFSCLDEAVFYLRKVHHFCFYCGQAFSCASELRAKCGDLHLRRSGASERGYNERIAAVTEFIRVLKTLSRNVNADEADDSDEAVNAFLSQQSIIKVEEEKYRCSHCSKAFKGPEYVLKHLHLKHADVVGLVREDLKLFNDFLAKASILHFPHSMVPRYLSLKPLRLPSSRESSKSSLGSASSSARRSQQQQDYKDWDALQQVSTEISYDYED